LFITDNVESALVSEGLAADSSKLEAAWRAMVTDVLGKATLSTPGDVWQQTGGRIGRHTEHLGHMLAEMQSVARAHPGANW
jgi:ring-1,2-phenylacetyl-CoA epoxidase subunit PaaC